MLWALAKGQHGKRSESGEGVGNEANQNGNVQARHKNEMKLK